MRTTIDVDEHLLRTFKARAAQRGTTLSAEIEEALRVDAARQAAPPPAKPFKLRTVDVKLPPGVDVNSNAALSEFLDGDDDGRIDGVKVTGFEADR
jgi:hypothetical protein